MSLFLHRVADVALGLLAPDESSCVCCGEEWFSHTERGLCPDCARRLLTLADMRATLGKREPFMPSAARGALDYADALYIYGDGSSQQIWALKYHGRVKLGNEMGMAMRPLLDRLPVTVDAIIPVPLHRARQRERGFNQSEALCVGMCGDCDIPVLTDALLRTRRTNSQTQFSHEQRTANVSGAFSVDRDFSGMRVLLVDDVLTTGATTAECAITLRNAGAEWVGAIGYASILD